MNKVITQYQIILILSILSGLSSACGSGLNQFGPTSTPYPPTPTINELISKFNSQDFYDRVDAASQASYYSDHSYTEKAQLVPYLAKSLTEPDNDSRVSIRTLAADSIGNLRVYDEQAIKELILWIDLGNQGGEINLQAIETLEIFAEYAQDAVPGLIRELMLPSTHTRVAAANTLSAIGDPVAIPYLLSIVLSPNESWVRQKVARALAEYGLEARCTVPYLIPLLDDPEKDIRMSAARVIMQATGIEHQFVDTIKEWWQKTGQHETWPQCRDGLNGKPVLPTPDIF